MSQVPLFFNPGGFMSLWSFLAFVAVALIVASLAWTPLAGAGVAVFVGASTLPKEKA